MKSNQFLFLALTVGSSVLFAGCASSGGDDAEAADEHLETNKGGTSAQLNSAHGLSGPLAVISDGHILYASARQGKCEFTMVGAVGAHAIADQAEIYTGAGFFGKAEVDIAAKDSVGFKAAALPAGCEDVFSKAQVAAGTRFKTTANLSSDAIGFRTILVDK